VISGVTRTIETTWHATFRLPTLITEKNSAGTVLRTTGMTYDTVGNMLTRTITDVPLSKSRTWTYTYNANGQVLTMNGPRTDVSDVTTYTYYANNDSDLGKRGNIAQITNALGHVTSITSYNALGQPLTITDPNGLTTTLAYDSRMRLTSRNVGGEITSYTYDGGGQLTNVTLPDASYLAYTYDAAHRLTQITDSLGNKIVYTLDAMGNRTQEQVFDPGNVLAQTRSRVFSSLNRLTQEIGAASQTTTYGYDSQGNVTSIDGPLAGAGDTTTNLYDALNRLTRMTDPNTGQINYGYTALDQVTTVQDPRTLTTSYGYDALNNLNSLTSPDTGASSKTFDAAGNVLTATDARGKTGTYTYDALNRVTSVSYGTNNASNVTYIYDTGTYGLGRLTRMNYTAVGQRSTLWSYDQKGRVIRMQQNLQFTSPAWATTVVDYAYDSQGRLSSIYYPSGKQMVYGYDSAGRISSVTVDGHALVSNVAYHPFGAPKSWNWGNGGTSVRTFDSDGRMATHKIGGTTRTVSYDSASCIYQIDDGTPLTTNTYTYDTLDRLTSFISSATNQAYTYDLTGNRTQLTIGANTYSNTIASTSNRLSGTSGPAPAKTYTYDAAGNRTSDGTRTFTYRDDGRYSATSLSPYSTSYMVNGMGQRVNKSGLVFAYDEAGRLIGEYGMDPQREYVYLGEMLVGVLTNNAYVLDNSATTTTVVGTWPTSWAAYTTGYGVNFRTHAAGTGTSTFTWTPTLPASGSYRVYTRWVAGADRATNSTYEITGTAGTTPVAVNQQTARRRMGAVGDFRNGSRHGPQRQANRQRERVGGGGCCEIRAGQCKHSLRRAHRSSEHTKAGGRPKPGGGVAVGSVRPFRQQHRESGPGREFDHV
jgi:YD repeat-containing protein